MSAEVVSEPCCVEKIFGNKSPSKKTSYSFGFFGYKSREFLLDRPFRNSDKSVHFRKS